MHLFQEAPFCKLEMGTHWRLIAFCFLPKNKRQAAVTEALPDSAANHTLSNLSVLNTTLYLDWGGKVTILHVEQIPNPLVVKKHNLKESTEHLFLYMCVMVV